MPGHGNFTSITLGAEGGADVLKVNGESVGEIDLVKTILVVITPKDVARTLLSATASEELPSASVALPAGQSRWTATFSREQAPVDAGDTVLLTGVMTSEDTGDAFVWAQALRIAPDTAPPKVR
jgi:hypothetical protein